MKYLLSLLVICAFMTGAAAQGKSKQERRALRYYQHAEQRSGSSFTYMYETAAAPYADLTGAVSVNNGELWDDPEYVIPIPFPFTINGTEVSSLTIYGLGALLISDPEALNSAELLIPFEVDLMDRGTLDGVSQSPISYKVQGDPGSQILIIEWKNAGSYDEIEELGTNNMFVNIQVWLYEGTDNVEVHFGPSFIDDPNLFYFEETGAFIGITSADFETQTLYNEHFLTGPAENPYLTELVDDDIPVFIDGTPTEGTVYRFFLSAPLLDVLIEGLDGSCGVADGYVTALASGGVEPYSYLWNTGDTTQTINNPPTGSYEVTVTDAVGTTGTSQISIFNGTPVVANASATDETGPGFNDGTATANPEGGQFPYTYEWSTGSTDQTLFDLSPGSYTVTVTDDNGCTDWQTVTVNPFNDCPEFNIIFDFLGFNCPGDCNAGIEILDVEGAVQPVSYEWSTGSTDPQVIGLCAGTYTLVITDAEGCTGAMAFAISDLPPISPNAGSTDETADDANDGTAWAAPTGGDEPYTYAWSTGETDSLIIGLAPGVYTVTVTDLNGCTAEQTVIVNPFGCDLVVVDTITGSCNSCSGSISLTVTTSAPPVSFLWSTGDTTSVVSALCAGTYTVTVSDTAGCVISAAYALSDFDQLIVVAESTHETATDANDGTSWAIPSGGLPPYAYVWSNGATDSLIVDLAPGTYGVTVTDANGCEAAAETVVFPFVCMELVSTTLSEISCFGGCDGGVTVTVFGGVGPFEFLWNTGDTSATLEGLCAGTYSLFVSDLSQGCAGFIAVTLGEPELLDFTLDSVSHVTDSTTGAIFVTPFGGTPPYSYSWFSFLGFSSNEEDVTELDPDVYYLQITDANGCEVYLDSLVILDMTVSVNDLPKIDVTAYPNPAHDRILLNMDSTKPFVVELTDTAGRPVQAWSNTTALDIRQVPAGMYFLKVSSETGYFSGRIAIVR